VSERKSESVNIFKGTHDLNPIQWRFADAIDAEDQNFTPTSKYNEGDTGNFCTLRPTWKLSEFLESISEIELEGYEMLLDFAKTLLRSRNPEVGEGITRPRHMLLEFEVRDTYEV